MLVMSILCLFPSWLVLAGRPWLSNAPALVSDGYEEVFGVPEVL